MLRLHLFVWIGCAAFAQTAEKPAEWIRSAEPVKRAWAAHWIAEQRIESLVPELKRMVAELAPPGAPAEKGVTDPEAAKLAGMDALIQLRESVPLADLEPLISAITTFLYGIDVWRPLGSNVVAAGVPIALSVRTAGAVRGAGRRIRVNEERDGA